MALSSWSFFILSLFVTSTEFKTPSCCAASASSMDNRDWRRNDSVWCSCSLSYTCARRNNTTVQLCTSAYIYIATWRTSYRSRSISSNLVAGFISEWRRSTFGSCKLKVKQSKLQNQIEKEQQNETQSKRRQGGRRIAAIKGQITCLCNRAFSSILLRNSSSIMPVSLPWLSGDEATVFFCYQRKNEHHWWTKRSRRHLANQYAVRF